MNKPMRKNRAAKWRLNHPRNAARFMRDIGAGKPGGGTIAMRVIRPAYLLEAMVTDPVGAAAALRAIPKWLQTISQIEPGHGPLCLACETEFSRARPMPIAFVLTTPYFDNPTTDTSVLLTGVCSVCTMQSDDELLAAARRLWLRGNPSAKELPPEGHA